MLINREVWESMCDVVQKSVGFCLVIAQTSVQKKNQALLMTKLSPKHGDNKID